VLRLNPVQGDDPRSIGLLGSHDVIATLDVVAGWAVASKVIGLLRAALAGRRDMLVGVSELPNRCGAGVRQLGPTSKAVRAALATAWNAARLELLGAPAPDPRKG
jgi:urease accessory protein